MPYKLTKTPDPTNESDFHTVTVEAPDDLTIVQLLELFEYFMQAAGFAAGELTHEAQNEG